MLKSPTNCPKRRRKKTKKLRTVRILMLMSGAWSFDLLPQLAKQLDLVAITLLINAECLTFLIFGHYG